MNAVNVCAAVSLIMSTPNVSVVRFNTLGSGMSRYFSMPLMLLKREARHKSAGLATEALECETWIDTFRISSLMWLDSSCCWLALIAINVVNPVHTAFQLEDAAPICDMASW